ncbi:MAG: MFS transporter [Gemmataceae bacterium]
MSHDPYAALRWPDYRCLLTSSLCSATAFGITTVAVAVEVYNRTGSTLDLGLTGLAQFVPILVLALPAGQLVDHVAPKSVFQGALAFVAGGYFGLALLTHLHGPLWAIFTCLVLVGMGRTFIIPARFAMLRQVVPLHTLGNAVNWNSSGWQVASISGPVLGGLMLWLLGARDTFLLATALTVLALTLLIPTRPTPRSSSAGSPRDLAALFAGVRFIVSHPLLLSAISLDLFAVLLGGATALLPVFAKEVFHIPEGKDGLAVGLLRAAPALGAVVIAVWMAHRPPLQRPGRALLLAVAVFGLTIIAFGLSRSFWLSFVVLAISGAADNISVIIRGVLVQTLTPDVMRGRVAAVNAVFISSSNELGEFESGVTAKWFGTVPAVILGGLGTLGVVAVCGWLFPQLWRLGPLHTLKTLQATPEAIQPGVLEPIPPDATAATKKV